MTTPPVPRWQPRPKPPKPPERPICGAVHVCTRKPLHRGRHGGWRKVTP